MARGYDGSITIDTKIDEKGFNKGLKNLGGRIKELGAQMAMGALRMIQAFTQSLAIIGLVVFAVSKLVKGISDAINKVISMGNNTQALKEDFAKLKASVANAFLPLLHVALPLLQRVAQWLTRIFNIIGMVIGALMGQTHVMQATADAASGAAGGAGQLAKNTKDAEKAAKGALASFDEINVLQMEEPEEEQDLGGGGGGGVGTGFTMVPITDEIMTFVQKVLAFLEPLKEPLQNLWDALVGLGEAALNAFLPWIESMEESGLLEKIRDLVILGIEWLTEKIIELTDWINNNQEAFRILMVILGIIAIAFLIIISPVAQVIAIIIAVIAVIGLLVAAWPAIKEAAIEAWEGLKKGWSMAGEWFNKTVWQPITTWAATALNNIGEFFTDLWTSITDWAANVLNTIGSTFDNMAEWAATALNNIGEFFSKAWDGIVEIWGKAGEWFGEIWDSITEGFETAWTGMKNFLKGIVNGIIDLINGMINAIISGINSVIRALNTISIEIPSWVPVFGGSSFGINISELSAPQIPHLATGAVIPPNSQFLAVLGDQRSGRNIETPEGLMRQIVREELEGMGGSGRDITINFGGSLGALVRELKPYIEREDKRVGVSLVRGI